MAAAPSLTGKQLGVYRLGSLLGTGGMGEVYRATDTRLKRDVAVKVLPASFAHDADRVRRLEREARLLAALNHPNIAVIYGVEEGDGLLALVLELVEGRTLAERIAGGRLAISEVSHVASQIAHALEAAHEKGIIHRDLKPANIKVRPDGVVKVLDFGLAKAFTGDGAPADEAPTVTAAGTRDGVVVGTAAYMSPEQARGQPVDKRTDIWAFGCVLYEMLAGRSPFAGATWSDTIAAVLNREPDWASLPRATPSSMRRLLRRCLEKDPQHRIRDIADARFDLDEEPPGESVAAHQQSQWLKRLAAPAVLGLIAAAGLVFWYGSRTRPPSTAALTAMPLTTYPGNETHPSLSPDSNQIAFAWNGQRQDNVDIYVKLIGAGEPIRLTTDPAVDTSPAWSPDGRWIAFVRLLPNERATLILVPALSGPEQQLGEIAVTSFIHKSALGSAVSWSPDSSSLIIADKPPDEPQGLFAFSAATRSKRRLTTLPPRAWTDIGPALSPDGRTLAFVRFIAFGVGDLYLLSVTEDLQPMGDPKRLTQQNRFATAPTWTRDGRTIIFSSASSLTASVAGLVAVDASAPEGAAGQPRRLTSVGESASYPVISRTSGGGRSRMVYTQSHADTSIWRVELPAGGVTSAVGVRPLPFVRSTRPEHSPQYSPDGQKVVFVSHSSGDGEIWVCHKDGGNLVQLTTAGWAETQGPRWSPDGSQIVFAARRDGPSDIFAISATGGAPKPITDDPAEDWGPSWSRDGQWIYFTSNRTDRSEIWKVPTGGGMAVQVTRSGGTGPTVSPDGRYVYFVRQGQGLWRLEVDTGAESRIPISPMEWNGFSPTESGIYVIPRANSGGEYSIQFYSFSTQKTHNVVQLERRPFLGLTVSPDERWLLYSQSEQFDSDLMLVEDFR